MVLSNVGLYVALGSPSPVSVGAFHEVERNIPLSLSLSLSLSLTLSQFQIPSLSLSLLFLLSLFYFVFLNIFVPEAELGKREKEVGTCVKKK